MYDMFFGAFFSLVLLGTVLLFLFAPIALLIWAIISIYRYASAKRANKRAPDAYSREDLRKRLTMLIVSLVMLAISLMIDLTLVLIVVGITYLMYLPIAFM